MNLALPMALLAAAGCASGAATGGLKLTKMAATVEKPANISVYVDVRDKAGAPVPNLRPASFSIFEDGQLVPEKKAKRALLEPGGLEARSTLVLIDLSGPIVDSEDLPDLISAVGRFVDGAGRSSQTALGVFDGGDEVVPMVGFGAHGVREALESMRHYRPRGRVANVNGAIQQGLDQLQKQVASGSAPHRFGTLVLFTDRGDLAHKVPAATLKKALAEADVDLFIVAVGPKVNQPELAALIPAGHGALFVSADPRDAGKGLMETGRKLEDAAASRYLLSYCSPKRKGAHTVEVQIDGADDRGTLVHKFSADGFKAGCTPKRRPQFEAGE